MKKTTIILALAAGIALGTVPSLYLSRAQNAKPDPPRLQIVTYPSGATGFFDPDSGRLYLYDVNLVNCYLIREITSPGQPLRQLRG